MRSNPVEGMSDYLPQEVDLRDKLIDTILKTYKSSGFQRITTPVVESLDNLDQSDGGDNLKMIYRILKRGQKLESAYEKGDIRELSDLGLRYDLTVPLVRYYTLHQAKLPVPFKCIQIDRVYRAERPQRGRMREFLQCDIDILGSESTNCEIELIAVTSEALINIGIQDFTVRINHRELLRNMILHSGFQEESVNAVCVILDKMDKIGLDGLKKELTEKEFPVKAIDSITSVLAEKIVSPEQLIEYGAGEAAKIVSDIIEKTRTISGGRYQIEFDVTLVRGQGYYTGTIFEISCDSFGGTIAGGGRYDKLVGRFTQKDVPAVGFSIGFERIYSVLSHQKTEYKEKKSAALLYPGDKFVEAVQYSSTLHTEYDILLVETKKKLYKQLSQLEDQGFSYVIFLDRPEDWKELGKKDEL